MDNTKTISVDDVTDFDSIKDRICYRLINREANEELLRVAPFRKFQDLAIIYYLQHQATDAGMATTTVTNSLLRHWGTDEAVLFEHAEKNTKTLNRGIVLTLQDVLNGVPTEIQLQECDIDVYGCFDFSRSKMDILPMYVATNMTRTYGATIILYDGLLDAIADRIGSFFAIPSSIHDFIFIPDTLCTPESVTSLMKDINASELLAEEVLSENVYHFSTKDREFRIAT